MLPNDGGPAFPVVGAPGASEDYPGMTLRDYFAAHALPALLDGRLWGTGELKHVATLAYRFADEMLKAREQQA